MSKKIINILVGLTIILCSCNNFEYTLVPTDYDGQISINLNADFGFKAFLNNKLSGFSSCNIKIENARVLIKLPTRPFEAQKYKIFNNRDLDFSYKEVPGNLAYTFVDIETNFVEDKFFENYSLTFENLFIFKRDYVDGYIEFKSVNNVEVGAISWVESSLNNITNTNIIIKYLEKEANNCPQFLVTTDSDLPPETCTGTIVNA